MKRTLFKVIAVLAIASSLVAVIVFKQRTKAKEIEAWHTAKTAIDARTLRDFTNTFAYSEHIQLAYERLRLIEARDAFLSRPDVQSCLTFLKEHPSTEFTPEAMERLESLCLDRAIADLSKQIASTNGRSLREIISVLSAAQGQSPISALTPEETGSGLAVLIAARRSQQGVGVMRLQGIEPVNKSPIIVSDALGSSSFKMSGSLTTGDGKYKLTFEGVIGRGRSEGKSVVAGRGQTLLPGKGFESDGFNVLASQTISMQDDVFLVSAELPGEYILLEGGFGVSSSFTPACPMGEGSVFTFRGEVRDFFSNVTFSGDAQSPLRFALLKGSGLTYLCGRGTVKTFDGNLIQLPRSKISTSATKAEGAAHDK